LAAHISRALCPRLLFETARCLILRYRYLHLTRAVCAAYCTDTDRQTETDDSHQTSCDARSVSTYMVVRDATQWIKIHTHTHSCCIARTYTCTYTHASDTTNERAGHPYFIGMEAVIGIPHSKTVLQEELTTYIRGAVPYIPYECLADALAPSLCTPSLCIPSVCTPVRGARPCWPAHVSQVGRCREAQRGYVYPSEARG
jgi:hypothetical protein